MQSEYITILGIFASIVLAFTGGMTFSTSVLENISSSSIYRIIVISLILGLILFNVIWLLIDFLRDINGKTIRKWWIILLLNFLIIAGIAFMYFAYKGQWINLILLILQLILKILFQIPRIRKYKKKTSRLLNLLAFFIFGTADHTFCY